MNIGSIMRARFLLAAGIIIISCPPLQARDIMELKPVTITVTPYELLSDHPNRALTVIEPEKGQNLPDMLASSSVPLVLRRGPMQADGAIRGSAFSQVQIMLNGVSLSNPQTAHHNLDIPIPGCMIDRLESIRGQASGLYGKDAFAGVINLVTAPPPGKGLDTVFRTGSFNLMNLQARAWNMSGSHSTQAAVEAGSSGDYIPGTDFSTLSGWLSSAVMTGGGQLQFHAGLSGRDFGAWNYYGGEVFSREKTGSALIMTSFDTRKASREGTRASLLFSSHHDEFTYSPGFAPGLTDTETLSAELRRSMMPRYSDTLLSTLIHAQSEQVWSTSLGSHRRWSMATGLSIKWSTADLLGEFAARLDLYSDYGAMLSPTLSLGHEIDPEKRAGLIIGKAHRIPSYTELYYFDPSNTGLSSLSPENCQSTDFFLETCRTEGTCIRFDAWTRSGNDLIDWIKTTPGGSWTAANIDARLHGLEMTVSGKSARGRDWDIGASIVNGKSGTSMVESKYVLCLVPAVLSASVRNIIHGQWSVDSGARILFSRENSPAVPFRVQFSRSFTSRKARLVLGMSNIFNCSYEEIRGVPMPGRSMYIQIENMTD